MLIHSNITSEDVRSSTHTRFGGGMEMKLITLYLPEPYLKALDWLVDAKYYPNRAEAIRVAVRDLLSVEVWGRNANGRAG
jgi:antitoxin ParD1/3/4